MKSCHLSCLHSHPRIDVELPVILAPMAGVATPALASSVIKTGGFGFIGAGKFTVALQRSTITHFLANFDSSKLKSDLAEVRKSLGLASDSPIPVGVGFLGWCLDKTEVSSDPRIPAVLEQRPKAVLFAAGTDMGKYIAQVRQFDAQRNHKTIVFATVNSVEDALQATNDWKVDVLVAQGVLHFSFDGCRLIPDPRYRVRWSWRWIRPATHEPAYRNPRNTP